jgi:hypothetical protein
MYPKDNRMHHEPHIHVMYQDYEAVFSINTGQMLSGELPIKKTRLVELWIDLRREELFADWKLAINGEEIFKIKPLEVN